MNLLPTDEAGLTALFRRHGARDPQAWAASQVHEGINQLHRFMFLKQAWSTVVDADGGWIERIVAHHEQWPEREAYRLGATLKRLLASGAAREDLAELVRSQQIEVLTGLCYLLSDPSIDDPALAAIGWSLVETDEDGRPTARTIDLLHESVQETDPAPA
jgi:hypothetical protein